MRLLQSRAPPAPRKVYAQKKLKALTRQRSKLLRKWRRPRTRHPPKLRMCHLPPARVPAVIRYRRHRPSAGDRLEHRHLRRHHRR